MHHLPKLAVRSASAAALLALSLVFALPAPVQAADPVPITGNIVLTHPAPIPYPLNPSILLIQGTFSGQSSPGGSFIGFGVFAFDTNTFSYTGNFQWIYPGGSLYGTISGQDYFPATPEGYPTSMTLTFTGGTGLFSRYTGSVTAAGLDNFNPSPTGTSTVTAKFPSPSSP